MHQRFRKIRSLKFRLDALAGGVGLIVLIASYYGCSSSVTSPTESPKVVALPKAGSSFTFVRYVFESGSTFVVDSAVIIDSVIESGVELGSHTNVLHILRTDPNSRPSQIDIFYNFEPDGDIAQLFGSLAFPDQAVWMPYPISTARPWEGKTIDSIFEDVGIQFHVRVYDTVAFAGFGESIVAGHTLRTANISVQTEEQVTVVDTAQFFETIHFSRIVKFSPEIGYFTSDKAVQDNSGLGGQSSSVTELTLQRYRLQ